MDPLDNISMDAGMVFNVLGMVGSQLTIPVARKTDVFEVLL